MLSHFARLYRIDRLPGQFSLVRRVRCRRVHRGTLRLRRLLLVHVDTIVLVLLLLSSLSRAATAAARHSGIIQDERVAETVLLQAHSIVLREGPVVVLRQRVVLQLFELVARRHVPELLATVVIQDGARRLLMVPRPTADYNGVCWWHGHRTHADGYDVGRPRVHTDRMVLRHGRNDYILHDLAEFGGTQLTHRHCWHARLAHVGNDHLLVAALVVQLGSGLLHQHLPLPN